jgi:cold shock CspA family protein
VNAPRRFGPVRGTVREWHAVGGWGVIVVAPDELAVWTHFSDLADANLPNLRPGQVVELEFFRPGQDGYPARAAEGVVVVD